MRQGEPGELGQVRGDGAAPSPATAHRGTRSFAAAGGGGPYQAREAGRAGGSRLFPGRLSAGHGITRHPGLPKVGRLPRVIPRRVLSPPIVGSAGGMRAGEGPGCCRRGSLVRGFLSVSYGARIDFGSVCKNASVPWSSSASFQHHGLHAGAAAALRRTLIHLPFGCVYW